MTKHVQYSGGLVQSLEHSLVSAFRRPETKLTTKPSNAGNSFHVQLAYGSRRAQRDDESEQDVLAIIIADHPISAFYFGFVAAFELGPTRKYFLAHASLSVFQDIIGELTPLFRAEWHQEAASDEKCKHAQPHWHFVQHPSRIERIVRALRRSPYELTDFVPEQESELFLEVADCGRLHFAMTSLWNKEDIMPPRRLFDSHDFPKWFRGLTQYIADQIAYVANVTPRRLEDFTPTST